MFMKKKGLALALGTIMLALAGHVGFANAPIISQIPDVLVGDWAFNNDHGLTVDYNFFRYLNAFNLLNYVNDNDTANADLRAAFKEWPYEQDKDVSINDKLQLWSADGEDTADRTTWLSDSELTGGGTNWWMSFRDLVRSPGTSVPPPAFPDPLRIDGSSVDTGDLDYTTKEYLPWHNTPGAAGTRSAPYFRTVNMWVADEDQSVSNTFLVFSVNNGLNDLSGGFTTLFSDDFLGTTAYWTYVGASQYGLTNATSSGGAGAGYLGLAGGTNAPTGNAYYGRWRTIALDAYNYTHVIGHIPSSQIYHARYRLKAMTNSPGHPSNKTYLAQLRLGVQNGGVVAYLDTVVASAGLDPGLGYNVDSQLPDLGSTKNYDFFWSSMADTPNFQNLYLPGLGVDARTWMPFFDLLDFDAGSGTEDEGLWQMQSFVAGGIPYPSTLSLSSPASLRFELTNLVTGFSVNGSTSNMSVLTNNPSTGLITFNDLGLLPLGGNTFADTYIQWQRENTVDWYAGKLVRAKVWLSCPSNSDRLNYHWTRIRHSIGGGNIITAFSIVQNLQALCGNPGMPISRQDPNYNPPNLGPTVYDVYVSSLGGPPAAYFQTTPIDFTIYRPWALALDQIHNRGGQDNNFAVNPATGPALNPTHVTVHKILYEVLTEPATIP